ncbi:uncharacterized protein LOC105432620 [Pogonomyrmex barbatus]|uniref:Uncharacterized protein LOC105432620 n=1 Tax=Pogonomyrmex barbatus TaxID=144034 RepID=A0A6I9XJD9_9HYME|nr:uncharacterized protein LOC105432620 [Pogonomyrmex barbatus]
MRAAASRRMKSTQRGIKPRARAATRKQIAKLRLDRELMKHGNDDGGGGDGASHDVGVDALRGVDVGVTRIVLFTGRPSGLSLRSLPPLRARTGIPAGAREIPHGFRSLCSSRHPLRPPDY